MTSSLFFLPCQHLPDTVSLGAMYDETLVSSLTGLHYYVYRLQIFVMLADIISNPIVN